ncbi:MAG: hypothetical protein JWR00_2411 [Rubritepida sp.]|nr:hypothetical protein [Rubritepida sp.]
MDGRGKKVGEVLISHMLPRLRYEVVPDSIDATPAEGSGGEAKASRLPFTLHFTDNFPK